MKDDSLKIQHLHGQVEHLRRGIAIESLTPAARDQLHSLFSMSNHACDLIVQHRILESLAFEGMYGRYEIVDHAHFKTLRWIFGDSLDDQVEEKEEPKDKPGDELKDKREGDQEGERDAEKKADRDRKVKNKEKEEDETKASARELLLNWMSSGAGIFHISGKLGSGKSTLMKYLCDHDCTKSLLREWAGKFLHFRQ